MRPRATQAAVLSVPADRTSGVALRGRYEGEGASAQIVEPKKTIDDLLGTVVTVQGSVVAALGLVALATAATALLVFMLSLRLRRREIDTMTKIGGSRARVAAVMVSVIVVVLLAGGLLAIGLTVMTGRFGEAAVRALLLS